MEQQVQAMEEKFQAERSCKLLIAGCMTYCDGMLDDNMEDAAMKKSWWKMSLWLAMCFVAGLLFAGCATPMEISLVRIGGRTQHTTSISRGEAVETVANMEAGSETGISDALKEFLNPPIVVTPTSPGGGSGGLLPAPPPVTPPAPKPEPPPTGTPLPALSAVDGQGNAVAFTEAGRTNPNRPTYRHSQQGSAIAGPLEITVGNDFYRIDDPSKRVEFADGSLWKPIADDPSRGSVFLYGNE